MLGLSFRLSLLTVVVLVASAATSARLVADDEPEPLAQRLRDDLVDGQLDRFSLFEAALVAGEVSDRQQITNLREQFEAQCRDAASEIITERAGNHRIEAVLNCLHQRFLRGEYQADHSELQRTLVDGHFNCVTSTILFRCLCERFGVPCETMASKAHVLCRQSGTPPRYIETTSPQWRITDVAQLQDRYKHAINVEDLREITDVQLVGKIYYNLGVARLEASQHAEAVDLLKFAWQLDPQDHRAYDNLLAALNNWALAECDAGRYQSASDLIQRGLAIDGSYTALRANDLHVHQKWVSALCSRQCFAEAIVVLDEVSQRRHDEEVLNRARLVIYGLWAQSQFARGEFESGWRTLGLANSALTTSDSKMAAAIENFEVGAAVAACDVLMHRRQFALASCLINEALVRHPGNATLLQRKLDLPEGGT